LKILFLFLFLACLPSDLIAQKSCPKCHMPLIDSGHRTAEFGKILKTLKCTNNHEFQVSVNEETSKTEKKSSGACDCPICGWMGHLTSHHNVRKCGNGHEFECK
jgi:hypothetical protein